jgi:sugar/nucleoside kinase (ribokinase family)
LLPRVPNKLHVPPGSSQELSGEPQVLVIGGAALDYNCRPESQEHYQLKTSLPGKITTQCGGVGRNIAEAISRLGHNHRSVTLCTALGGDAAGHVLRKNCEDLNIEVVASDGTADLSSGQYSCMLDAGGELVSAVADMDIFEKIEIPRNLDGTQVAIVDANIAAVELDRSCASLENYGGEIWFEPVSTVKAVKYWRLPRCDLITPNFDELQAILTSRSHLQKFSASIATAKGFSQDVAVEMMEAFAAIPGNENTTIVLTCGVDGCLVKFGEGRNEAVSSTTLDSKFRDRYILTSLNSNLSWLQPKPDTLLTSSQIVNVTGAGDSLTGAMAWATVYGGYSIVDSVIVGMECAVLSLLSESPINPGLHAHVVTET